MGEQVAEVYVDFTVANTGWHDTRLMNATEDGLVVPLTIRNELFPLDFHWRRDRLFWNVEDGAWEINPLVPPMYYVRMDHVGGWVDRALSLLPLVTTETSVGKCVYRRGNLNLWVDGALELFVSPGPEPLVRGLVLMAPHTTCFTQVLPFVSV